MVYWDLIFVSNEWIIWVFVSAALVVLYFTLRRFVWGDERPEERIILKRFLVVFLVSIMAAMLLIYAMKSTFQIPRPCVPCTEAVRGCNPYCPGDFSFPSGHAGTIFVLFTSFFMVYRRKGFLPFFVFPALVAYSRVFLGVHTYADVVFGSSLGIAITVAVWKTERIFRVLKA